MLRALSLLAACGGVPAPAGAPEPAMPTPTAPAAPDSPPSTAPASQTPPAEPAPPASEPPTATPTTPATLSGDPLARLRIAGNMVVALDHPLPQPALTALGVRSYRAFTATTPRVWLLVFEFADQAQLLAALPKIDGLIGDGDAPPYYRTSSHTGAWLLVTGFPGHKPVSPEMEAARTTFTSSWAGEE
jgi:hypothetical protein